VRIYTADNLRGCVIKIGLIYQMAKVVYIFYSYTTRFLDFTNEESHF